MAINTITLTPPPYFWPLHCLSFDIRLLITPLLYLQSFWRESCCSIFRVFVCSGLSAIVCLFVQYLYIIVFSVLLIMSSNYTIWYILVSSNFSTSVSLKKWEKNHFDNRLCWAPMNLRHSVVCQTALSQPSSSSKWYLLK